MIRKYLFFSLAFIFLHSAMAQDEEEVNVVGFRFLDYQSNSLPEDLLKTKSVVFVSVPTVSKTSSERGNWKKLAEAAHPAFRELGIDPVKYYYLDDVLSGEAVSEVIAAEMTKREIANIIVLSHVAFQIKNKDAERHVIVVTPFNGKPTFMDNGQTAWKSQGKNLDKVLRSLTKDAGKLGAAENLMILEVPEYAEGIDIFTGSRNESFNVDLRIDKLAVPKFVPIDIPANIPGGVINNNIKKEAEDYNEKVPVLNRALERAFSEYPYEYALVDPDEEGEALRAKGFDFILLRLNTSGESIKNILGYETNDMTDEYVTVKQNGGKTIFRRIPKRAPVYKYYIQHIYSGDVYLGTGWDADETWHEALQNHLENLVKVLEKQ